jgi:hypothetical protein
MRRFSTRSLVLVVLVGVLAGNSIAQPLTYDIIYNPTQLLTTVTNDAASQAAVQLRTYDPTAGVDQEFWYVKPGVTMTIKTLPGGGIQVGGGGIRKPPNPDPFISNTFNKPGQAFHIAFPPGPPGPNSPMIKLRSAPDSAYVAMVASMNFGGGCYRYKYKRSGPGFRIDDPIEAIVDTAYPNTVDEDTGLIYTDSTDPTYPFGLYPANQSMFFIESGHLRIDTTAGNFMTSFTPNTATGCPEPSTCAAAMAIAYLAKRKERASKAFILGYDQT